jgi:integrase
MASVFKKSVTRKLPEGAELFVRKGERFARWRVNDKPRTAPVTVGKNGELRIRTEAATYTARYRDGSNVLQEAATRCRDKNAALAVLKDLVTRAERVKSGILSQGDADAIDHQLTPLTEVLASYVGHLRGKGRSSTHVADCERLAKRAFSECGFDTLRDLSGEPLEQWLARLVDGGVSPRTRNSYLQAVRGFCRWCVQSGRLTTDPTHRIAKLAEATDVRRNRRALTPTELERLLYAAQWRPLAEFGRKSVKSDNPKGRATWNLEPLSFDTLDAAVERAREKYLDKPERVAELEQVGRERALIYKTLLLTGLRRGELASVTVGSLSLDSETPFLTLEAGDAKNRQRAEIPLRSDLATELVQWVATLSEAHTNRSGDSTGVLSIDTAKRDVLPSDTLLFASVTPEFLKVFDRDLNAASIDKSDDRGRTADIHALRHTYGSLLSAGGVSPRTAQAAMRHSSIDLTMNVYTDPRVLDVAGALDALPTLSLGAKPSDRQRNVATGTDDRRIDTVQPVGNRVALLVAPTSDKSCISLASRDNWAEKTDCTKERFHSGKQTVSASLERVADGIRTHDLRNHNPTF